eukprot:gnl/TRDRNA2_/TRDRNA2_78106_c0_seq1.p1 gnl/TRDRNA2_/TRDRNA2_78106_c0~~gnl/TRDRNA2_/TRDRNA2_78106_c0_seq1.p1  ORF type:complete len:458 (+),score=64.27 gnl/TRDRNA2_/TRDRNA2_78106_c0_seq1:192-1376(+)
MATEASVVADQPTASSLIRTEVSEIYSSRGVSGFFCGATLRAAWMGLGGFVFLGSFEYAKNVLTKDAAARSQVKEPSKPLPDPRMGETDSKMGHAGKPSTRQLGTECPPAISFAGGLAASLAVDVPLHPVDTVKTRLQAPGGFQAAGGVRGLWNGLSIVLLTSMPASAIFFVMYERVRHILDRQVRYWGLVDSSPEGGGVFLGAVRDGFAACMADTCVCIVRVPCEVLKQHMQTLPRTLSDTIAAVAATEGPLAFYTGFWVTVAREVPFAACQMVFFEELKHVHPWIANADDSEVGIGRQGFAGMQCGGLSGALAGAVTTPLDAVKTRIMLVTEKSQRLGIRATTSAILAESGPGGLLKGLMPRMIYCGVGGALWLGAFEWSKLLLVDRYSDWG